MLTKWIHQSDGQRGRETNVNIFSCWDRQTNEQLLLSEQADRRLDGSVVWTSGPSQVPLLSLSGIDQYSRELSNRTKLLQNHCHRVIALPVCVSYYWKTSKNLPHIRFQTVVSPQKEMLWREMRRGSWWQEQPPLFLMLKIVSNKWLLCTCILIYPIIILQLPLMILFINAKEGRIEESSRFRTVADTIVLS